MFVYCYFIYKHYSASEVKKFFLFASKIFTQGTRSKEKKGGKRKIFFFTLTCSFCLCWTFRSSRGQLTNIFETNFFTLKQNKQKKNIYIYILLLGQAVSLYKQKFVILQIVKLSRENMKIKKN